MPAKSHTDTSEPQRFAGASEWTAWLREHHASSTGVWMLIAKKTAAEPSVTQAEALDAALCYGWIDAQRKSFDADHYLQRYSPRTARSIWSVINRDKALALVKSRRMRAAGLREMESAQKDGRWDAAYASQRNMPVPDDLLQALKTSAEAGAFFKTLSSQNRYAILLRLHMAKRPETRLKRLETFVGMLTRHETIHPASAKN